MKKASESKEKFTMQEMDSQLSNYLSISRRTTSSGSILSVNLLNLDDTDFPDVCVLCEECME